MVASNPRRRTPNKRQPAAASQPTGNEAAAGDQQNEQFEQGEQLEYGAETAAQQTGVNAEGVVTYNAQRMRRDFLDTVLRVDQSGVEYQNLIAAIVSEGWFVQLRESGAVPAPDGGTLMQFIMLAGPDPVFVQPIDQITIKVPGNMAAPSLWARANSYTSIVMALFNRLPPNEGAQEARAAAGLEPATAEPEQRDDAWEPLDLVESRTADGLPIYYEPYALGDDPSDIIDSVLASLRNEVPEIQSSQAMATLWTENVNVFEYIKAIRPDVIDIITNEILNPRTEELLELETPARPAPRAAGSGRSPIRR